jgi:hypothetical protein
MRSEARIIDPTVAAAAERAERRLRGEDPFSPPPPPKRPRKAAKATAKTPETISLPLADYRRLIAAAGLDDTLLWCERCGAWIDHEDPAYLSTEDFRGCVWAATQRAQDKHLCRSHRSPGEVRHD